jgi:hypothetical protein
MPAKPRHPFPRRLPLALLGVVLIGAAALLTRFSELRKPAPAAKAAIAISDTELLAMRPKEEPHDGFVGSSACVECHENQHRSWSGSWHRTMTQEAKMDTFMGTIDQPVEWEGSRYEFSQRDGRPWFHVSNPPDDFSPIPGDRRDYPIVLTTGSHLMQLGWFPIGRANTLGLLPIAFLKEDQRWVPHASIFLQPPDARSSTRVGIWNDGCLRCHSTGPETRHENDNRFDAGFGFTTRVAEFGIACEACHGPGKKHVTLRREKPAAANIADDPIVNPSSLDHRRASEICGACHGNANPRGTFRATPFHLPGHALSERYRVHEPPAKDSDSLSEDGTTMYWPDGMARVSGAEFSGMRASRCYTDGDLSCLSCHTLHQSRADNRPSKEWASDMLRPDAIENGACLHCHDPGRFAERSHTIHAPESTGSRCNNCHMPHTSYGLLKAIRSHKITSPSVRETLDTGRLNACNLCHLDKTLDWTAKHLKKRYNQAPPSLTRDQNQISAALLQAMTGDAGQRALIAWAMSWKPAMDISDGVNWIPPHLAVLLRDPYSAVRYIAAKSLNAYPLPDQTRFDYLAPEEDRARQSSTVIDSWKTPAGNHPERLITPTGQLDREHTARLLKLRDDSDITLLE